MDGLIGDETVLEWNDFIEDYDGNDIEDDFYDITIGSEFNSMYRQYYNSMGKRRNGSQLNIVSFFNYASNYAYIYVFKNSYIIGQFQNGLFHVSHFAPSSMREGMEIIKDISHYNNIIFSVTSDLGPMLEKIGLYGDSQAKIPMFFRNSLVMKSIYTTDKRLISYLLGMLQNNSNIGDISNMRLNSSKAVDLNKRSIKRYENGASSIYSSNRYPMRYIDKRGKNSNYGGDNYYEYEDNNFYHRYAIMSCEGGEKPIPIGYCDSKEEAYGKISKIRENRHMYDDLFLYDYRTKKYEKIDENE